MTQAWVLETTLRLLGFSIFLQTLEMLAIRPAWSSRGPWQWGNLREEFRIWGRWGFAVLDRILSDQGYRLLLLIQGAVAVGCMAVPSPAWTPVLIMTVLLGCLRWRGTFNGGSDYMTVLVLVAFSVAQAVGSERAFQMALAYIGIQLLLSYFIAGIVKVKEREWRTGRALQVFLRTTGEGAPAWVSWMAGRQGMCALASWAVMSFELAAPGALLVPAGSVWLFVGMLVGLSFHLANALIFGLNRFTWAWVVGYGAVLILIQSN